MVLKFLCPNGHGIHCPDDRAGKAAKCPKCGIRFRIPAASELEESSGDSTIAAALDDSDIAGETDPTGKDNQDVQEQEDEIEFLCPNGHRLHGPASLQGQPGQCPECDSRFRIPSYDEMPDEDEESGEQIHILTESTPPSDGSAISLRDADEFAIDTSRTSDDELDPEDSSSESLNGSGVPLDAEVLYEPDDSWPISRLFPYLWDQRHQGGVVEIYQSDGKKISPDFFAAGLSQGTHAVFTVEDANGTYTVTALAWDSIARIVIRNLEQPDDLLQE